MTSPRKSKSNRIYRVELIFPEEFQHLNSTRQTLNHEVYARWRSEDRLHHDARAEIRFFMGEISWQHIP
jgi:hypothetical protein